MPMPAGHRRRQHTTRIAIIRPTGYSGSAEDLPLGTKIIQAICGTVFLVVWLTIGWYMFSMFIENISGPFLIVPGLVVVGGALTLGFMVVATLISICQGSQGEQTTDINTASLGSTIHRPPSPVPYPSYLQTPALGENTIVAFGTALHHITPPPPPYGIAVGSTLHPITPPPPPYGLAVGSTMQPYPPTMHPPPLTIQPPPSSMQPPPPYDSLLPPPTGQGSYWNPSLDTRPGNTYTQNTGWS